MGTTSPRRPASLSPSSVADLSTTAHEHRYPCSSDGDGDDDDFEFTPLLPRCRRGARTGYPRTTFRGTAHVVLTQPPPQRARRAPSAAAVKAAAAPGARRVRWHEMAFGSVRVPAAMDMREIRKRLQARRGDETAAATAGWAPWRLIRSLSCKGIEAVAVAAAAAPVRLV